LHEARQADTAQNAGGKKQAASGRPQKAKSERRKSPATVSDQRGQHVGKQINVAGDYVDQRGRGDKTYNIHIEHAEGAVIGDSASSHGVKSGAPLGAVESEWNTAAIRDLVNAAFSDQQITTLCFDRFRAVHDEFAPGMSKGQKIQQLLDFCVRQNQVGRLLAEVQQRNPAQYARFAPRLRNQ
jgi:hypothetical protein